MNASIRPNKNESGVRGHLISTTSPKMDYKMGDWLRIAGEPVLVIGTSAVGIENTSVTHS